MRLSTGLVWGAVVAVCLVGGVASLQVPPERPTPMRYAALEKPAAFGNAQKLMLENDLGAAIDLLQISLADYDDLTSKSLATKAYLTHTLAKFHFMNDEKQEAGRLLIENLDFLDKHESRMTSYTSSGIPIVSLLRVLAMDGLSEACIAEQRFAESQEVVQDLNAFFTQGVAELESRKALESGVLPLEEQKLLAWLSAKKPVIEWKLANPQKSEAEYVPVIDPNNAMGVATSCGCGTPQTSAPAQSASAPVQSGCGCGAPAQAQASVPGQETKNAVSSGCGRSAPLK